MAAYEDIRRLEALQGGSVAVIDELRVDVSQYIRRINDILPPPSNEAAPWEVTFHAAALIETMIDELKKGKYKVKDDVAIHRSAEIHSSAVIDGPAIVGPHCVIGPNARLSGGVYLGRDVVVGLGCSLASCFVMDRVHIEHGNYVGHALIGEDAVLEPGAMITDYLNERRDKNIRIVVNGEIRATGVEKFGSLIGDRAKIGANAVLTPGTLLDRNSTVRRLELIDQLADFAANGPAARAAR